MEFGRILAQHARLSLKVGLPRVAEHGREVTAEASRSWFDLNRIKQSLNPAGHRPQGHAEVQAFAELGSEEALKLAALASERLQVRKFAAMQQPMTAERATELAQIDNPAQLFTELEALSPTQLRQLAELEPGTIDALENVLLQRQMTWLRTVNASLAPFGVKADGAIKSWESSLGTLERWTEENAAAGRVTTNNDAIPATLGDLHDLNRARVNTPDFDPTTMRRMVRGVQDDLQAAFPDRQFKFTVRDLTSSETMADPTALYKGRIHLRIEEVTDGVRRDAFELQVGPKHLASFFERPWALAGTEARGNLHDTVYKGLARLKEPEHFAAIGKQWAHKPELPAEAAAQNGRAVVNSIISEYRNQLNDLMLGLQQGQSLLDKPASKALRTQIDDIARTLKGSANVPESLRLR